MKPRILLLYLNASNALPPLSISQWRTPCFRATSFLLTRSWYLLYRLDGQRFRTTRTVQSLDGGNIKALISLRGLGSTCGCPLVHPTKSRDFARSYLGVRIPGRTGSLLPDPDYSILLASGARHPLLTFCSDARQRNCFKATSSFDRRECRVWCPKVLDWDARIFLYHNFLTDAECDHIRSTAEARLERSGVVREDGSSEVSTIRTSSGMFLDRGEDAVTAGAITDIWFSPPSWEPVHTRGPSHPSSVS
jgi:hypothetical protein